jgi:hypothetical protein
MERETLDREAFERLMEGEADSAACAAAAGASAAGDHGVVGGSLIAFAGWVAFFAPVHESLPQDRLGFAGQVREAGEEGRGYVQPTGKGLVAVPEHLEDVPFWEVSSAGGS